MNKQNEAIKISVIIVTYNASEYITECLESLQNQSYQEFETIIVDNHSADKTINVIKSNFPWTTIIASAVNKGFAGGVNLGYRDAQGDYIALLNPDTRIDKHWLRNLVIAMEQNDKIGICASLMLQWESSNIDTAGDGCTRAGKGFKRGNNQNANLYQENVEVFAACGGATLLRRKMLDEIGLMDEDFFLLHEDTDLSFRAKLAGWKCIFVHNAIVEHKVSAAIGYKSSLSVYHSVKNSDQVWLKNMPGLMLITTLPEKIISDIATLIYLGIIHRKYKEYFKAKLYIVKNLRKILQKRTLIQGSKKITNQELKAVLTPFISKQYLRVAIKEKWREIFGCVSQ